MGTEEIEKLKLIKDSIGDLKGKDFKNLSSSDKDKLLEALCKMFGLIQ